VTYAFFIGFFIARGVVAGPSSCDWNAFGEKPPPSSNMLGDACARATETLRGAFFILAGFFIFAGSADIVVPFSGVFTGVVAGLAAFLSIFRSIGATGREDSSTAVLITLCRPPP
jgi:hypothetical protein